MILVLGGTSDSIHICNKLNDMGLPYIVSVTTEYGRDIAKKATENVFLGKLTKEDMVSLIKEKNITQIIDATHPYATVVSSNAIECSKITNIDYVRFERESLIKQIDYENKYVVENIEQACQIANEIGNNIFIGTGSKNLDKYIELIKEKNLIARVLPTSEVLESCEGLGLNADNIIAMKGPFSEEMNIATYKQYNIDLLITKESGVAGGFLEKINACKVLNIPVIIISRKKTIEACERKISENLEGYDFYRAFTSNMIINKLKKRDNMFIDNPVEALQKLADAGYEEVVVQTLHIICGEEYNKLKEQVESFRPKFKRIALGRPLLTTIEDYKETVEAVRKQLEVIKPDEAIVFMGHGTTHESHSAYPALEYMFRDNDMNVYIGTVEGYPEIEQVIKKLKADNIKTVDVLPFMLVAGDHATNDMASDEEDSWKSILEKEGFKVNIHLQGLGEYPAIQDKFVNHALDCAKELEKELA